MNFENGKGIVIIFNISIYLLRDSFYSAICEPALIPIIKPSQLRIIKNIKAAAKAKRM